MSGWCHHRLVCSGEQINESVDYGDALVGIASRSEPLMNKVGNVSCEDVWRIRIIDRRSSSFDNWKPSEYRAESFCQQRLIQAFLHLASSPVP